ncbi:transmembrane protein 214-A-like [Montipora foliosa]|uniref:transmembrane protein 214-A-like n=1 Tax=Montipora foliosa TaxID=591990 RepID=UPI0035F126B7
MASDGKWEVVGKNGKKRALNETKKNKGKLDMPKADFINPLGDSKTIYQAFKEPKETSSTVGNGHVKHDASKVPDELPAVLARKVPEQAPQGKKSSSGFVGSRKKQASSKAQKTDEQLLKEAIAKLDLDELTALQTNLESYFPNNPSIWLTDIAAHLQLKLKGVPQKDPTFEGKPLDYPMCLLPSHLTNFLRDLLKRCMQPALKMVYQRSIGNIVDELSKGLPAYGDQIILQFVVQQHPQVILENMTEIQEMLTARKTHTREALALMWCAGQLPDKNLAWGLKVWMEVMIPYSSMKHLTKFIVSYLETLLSICKATSNQELVIKPDDFFTIMELVFSSSSPLVGNPSLQRKMLSLYLQVKRLSISSEPGSLSTLYFPLLIGCLNSKLSLEYQTEVLNCLMLCLEKDNECFTKWENSYTTVLLQSGFLLNHIIDTWDSLSAALKDKIFNFVHHFQARNNLLLEKGKTKVGLNSCVKACQVIEDKKVKAKKASRFSFGKIFKLILFVLVAVIAVDVYKHKGYKASKTAQIAKEYGIEQAALTGYGHVTKALDQGHGWVQTNYPVYYRKFREVSDPAAAFAWQKLTVAGNFIAEITKPARDYLNVKIPELLEKIEKEGPVYYGIVRDHVKNFVDAWWPVVYKYLVIIWDFLSENVPIVFAKTQELLTNLGYKIYELAPDFFSSVASGLAKFGEKIVEKLPDVIAVIQEYAIIAFNLAVNLINSVVEWIQNMAASSEVEDVAHSKPSAVPSKSVPH